MKRHLKKSVLALSLVLLGILAIAASISGNLPVPATWSAANGTNQFGLNSDAVPVIMRSGTNYTGISTNAVMSSGAATNTYIFVKGILTSVQ